MVTESTTSASFATAEAATVRIKAKRIIPSTIRLALVAPAGLPPVGSAAVMPAARPPALLNFRQIPLRRPVQRVEQQRQRGMRLGPVLRPNAEQHNLPRVH